MIDSALDDRELIDKYLGGDGNAFGELVGRYQHLVYNLCFRVVGDDEAPDLTQEIFIRLLDKVSLWRGEAKFSTWLYRLAINHCRDHLRRHRPDPVEMDHKLADPAPGPEQRLEARDLQERLMRALMRLPVDSRAVVFLRDVEGFSYLQIAEILELELGTVKSRLARARLALAQTLAPAREQIGPVNHQRG